MAKISVTEWKCANCLGIFPIATYKRTHSWCRNCSRLAAAERRNKIPGLYLAKYGITLEDYNRMLVNQKYSCAICRTQTPSTFKKAFYVDHDHQTQKVRGLLCFSCNTALGHFKDNADVLQQAITYLRKTNGF